MNGHFFLLLSLIVFITLGIDLLLTQHYNRLTLKNDAPWSVNRTSSLSLAFAGGNGTSTFQWTLERSK